jgi:hypothetical protein
MNQPRYAWPAPASCPLPGPATTASRFSTRPSTTSPGSAPPTGSATPPSTSLDKDHRHNAATRFVRLAGRSWHIDVQQRTRPANARRDSDGGQIRLTVWAMSRPPRSQWTMAREGRVTPDALYVASQPRRGTAAVAVQPG